MSRRLEFSSKGLLTRAQRNSSSQSPTSLGSSVDGEENDHLLLATGSTGIPLESPGKTVTNTRVVFLETSTNETLNKN